MPEKLKELQREKDKQLHKQVDVQENKEQRVEQPLGEISEQKEAYQEKVEQYHKLEKDAGQSGNGPDPGRSPTVKFQSRRNENLGKKKRRVLEQELSEKEAKKVGSITERYMASQLKVRPNYDGMTQAQIDKAVELRQKLEADEKAILLNDMDKARENTQNYIRATIITGVMGDIQDEAVKNRTESHHDLKKMAEDRRVDRMDVTGQQRRQRAAKWSQKADGKKADLQMDEDIRNLVHNFRVDQILTGELDLGQTTLDSMDAYDCKFILSDIDIVLQKNVHKAKKARDVFVKESPEWVQANKKYLAQVEKYEKGASLESFLRTSASQTLVAAEYQRNKRKAVANSIAQIKADNEYQHSAYNDRMLTKLNKLQEELDATIEETESEMCKASLEHAQGYQAEREKVNAKARQELIKLSRTRLKGVADGVADANEKYMQDVRKIIDGVLA